MAVPASGELKLWDSIWNSEIGGTKGSNSLHSASIYAGFTTPDAMSDFYGWSDVEVPTVTTNNFSSIATTSMTANGTVNTTGNENPTRGFYFGTNSTLPTNNTKYSIGIGGTGAFSRSMTGLSAQTTYYGWAFACNSAGETTGAKVTVTSAAPPFTPCYGFIDKNEATATGNYAYVQAYSGWSNPYTGGGNNQAFAGGFDSGYINRTVTCNSKIACNARNYTGASVSSDGCASIIIHQQDTGGRFTCVTTPQNHSSTYINNNAFASSGYLGRISTFCLTSDIRLKTNINYL